MNGEIKASDYHEGLAFTVVRDIHGTRAGIRSIPRGHHVALLVMVTAHPDTAGWTVFHAGEEIELDPVVGAEALRTVAAVVAAHLGFNAHVEIEFAGGRYE
jgi:hypothetical protein